MSSVEPAHPASVDVEKISDHGEKQMTEVAPKTVDAKDDAVIDVEKTGEEKDKDETSGGFGAYLKLWKWCAPVDVVLRICGFFAAIASGTTVYIHTTCFTITAVRGVRRLRLEYIKAILRQDMAYFDTYTPGSVATRISNNANLIQNGLSEKVGTAVQGFAMLIAAFVVAFTRSWRLTLPVATSIPTAVTLVGITVVLDTKIEAKVLDIYSKAGGLVEETLSSIRVVVAFGAGGKLRKKYDEHLDSAKKFGGEKGPHIGCPIQL
ncbi:leptomycin B resistance protein pmd1 [Coccidioides immitis RMSCC 3703]|uniref:Leptomycin B resistance protein pmd1 n=1 Tax=Coccidioides immitis RMSCC 3703 TaxID=454286 RepID=A0A0J8R0G3_COCIT|nr:leptomycin B resistance protein pmd1 [Coccidioides immitis RMSCC 3703]